MQVFSGVLKLPGLQLGVYLCGLSSSGKCSLPVLILKRKSYIFISFYCYYYYFFFYEEILLTTMLTMKILFTMFFF